jgi:hypothetical protein
MTQAISGSIPSFDPTEMFKKMDTNGDGKVSKEELTTMLQSMSKDGNSISSNGIDELFKAIDTNGDGSISESENTAQLQKHKPSGPPPPKSTTASEIATTLEDIIKSLMESFNSTDTSDTTSTSATSSTSSTSSASTLTDLINSLKGSKDDETTSSILQQIRSELLAFTKNNGDTYNQNGISTSSSSFQSIFDVTT